MTGDENTAFFSVWECFFFFCNAREGTIASKTAAVTCTIPFFKTGALGLAE